MTWARFDDRYDDSKKLKRAWRRDPRAVGLHAMAITYCSRHETDGFVDTEWVEEKLPNVKERAKTMTVLVDVGLFHESPGGFTVNDYLQFNPSQAELEEKRRIKAEAGRKGGLTKAERERQAKAIAGASELLQQTPSNSHSSSHAPVPSRPIPSHPVPVEERAERITRVQEIFQRSDLSIDEVSVLNALERFPELDHEQLAMGCAEWCRTHGRPPGLTFHRFLQNEARDLAETQVREEHKPTHAGMNARETCKDCGVPIKTGKRCRECDRQLEARNTGAAA